MRSRSTLLPALVLTVGLLVVPGASHALAPPVSIEASKKENSAYTQDPQAATIKEGERKRFFWKVKNPEGGGSDGDYAFDDAATDDGPGYRITWFKGTKTRTASNVSASVEGAGAGYSFHVKDGKSKYFTAKVVALDDSDPLCISGQVEDPGFSYFDSVSFAVNGDCV